MKINNVKVYVWLVLSVVLFPAGTITAASRVRNGWRRVNHRPIRRGNEVVVATDVNLPGVMGPGMSGGNRQPLWFTPQFGHLYNEGRRIIANDSILGLQRTVWPIPKTEAEAKARARTHQGVWQPRDTHTRQMISLPSDPRRDLEDMFDQARRRGNEAVMSSSLKEILRQRQEGCGACQSNLCKDYCYVHSMRFVGGAAERKRWMVEAVDRDRAWRHSIGGPTSLGTSAGGSGEAMSRSISWWDHWDRYGNPLVADRPSEK